MKRNKYRRKAGFTLIEVITVISIMSILAAVAIPSMIGFIEHGKQVNRMNIARTLYLSIQNQFTKSNVEKNLKSTITGLYFEKDINDYYTDMLDYNEISTRNVAESLGYNFPVEEEENKDNIHYISLPKNYIPLTDIEIETYDAEKKAEAVELRNFYYLLDEIIIDKSILKNAILVEYNIKTGVVLSVFYGDAFDGEETRFEYKDETNNDRNNVTGGRGTDDGYQYASQRKQGYYGVESTGEVPPLSLNLKDIVNIYDGADKPLELRVGVEKVNVLYVELLLADSSNITEDAILEYTFEIINAKSIETVISVTVADLNNVDSLQDFSYLFNVFSDDAKIYHDINPVEVEQYGIDVGGYYNRYIWIIDYIEGDIISDQSQSIGVNYKDNAGKIIKPQNVRVKVSKVRGKVVNTENENIRSVSSITSVTSLTLAHTHFASEMSGSKFEVKSARHLNNIRYAPADSKYRQTKDINLQLDDNTITNFAPISIIDSTDGIFKGEYYAMKDSDSQWKIIGLKIDESESLNSLNNIGLFAEVSGNIQGVSLYKAEINVVNGGNVGAIAGKVTNEGTIKQCNSYANINVNSNNDASVGGLVGYISGTLEQSFNAGFYDAVVSSETSEGFGSIKANKGNVGGLVGMNSGIIQNCFNNARVNIKDVSVTDEDKLSYDPTFSTLTAKAYIGGIVGCNDGGTIKNTYATNHVSMTDVFGTIYGGISGTNIGNYKLNNNFFLANGCTGNTGNEAIDKEQLYANPCGTMFAKSDAVSQDNLYKNYPYPILKNNNPFADPSYDWVKYTCGWEDIQSAEADPGDARLIYYELYNDNTWGYHNSIDIVNTIVPNTSSKRVVNDGYGIEILSRADGYTLVLGAKIYKLTVSGTENAPILKVFSDSEIVVDWPIEVLSSDDGIVFRVFIPNSVIESISKITVYSDNDADIVNDEPIMESPSDFNPLFAPSVHKLIRSPRHIDNVDKVPNGNYTQQLNLDFSIYCKELNSNLSLNNTKKMTFTESVIANTFTGSYDGNGKQIMNLIISASLSDNIGLFSTNSGIIKNITLLNPVIKGKKNVGAIAGSNSGTVTFCAVQTAVAMPSATAYSSTDPVTIQGEAYVGGIIGNNTGTLSDVYLVSNSNNAAVFRSTGTDTNIGGIVGTTSTPIERVLYIARFHSGIYKLAGSLSGSATVINGYYLSRKDDNHYYSVGGSFVQTLYRAY